MLYGFMVKLIRDNDVKHNYMNASDKAKKQIKKPNWTGATPLQ